MRAKELKTWMGTIPDEAVLEVRERNYGPFVQDFQMRVVFPMLVAKEEVDTQEEV